MTDLSKIYMPITADPFENNDSYTEIMPSAPLKPYIRCFWGTKRPVTHKSSGIVIPDTCMDIIFHFYEGGSTSFFCHIDEAAHSPSSNSDTAEYSTFAVRFYPWSAAAFAEYPDMSIPTDRPEDIFPKLTQRIYEAVSRESTLMGRSKAAEAVLYDSLRPENQSADVMNALYFAIISGGNIKISDLASYTALSSRTLQRKFSLQTGMSPKILCDLIRYQLLWQETAMGNGISILDAVEKYGYYDQSHLLGDFRKRHLMTPAEAVKYLHRNR
ncbi:MAG: AraC family transcriptional regulator [Oscillospiraceae bacterium]|nr:AraC family transcriptional regulator [Oscillospiraceae bacterium]